MQGLMQDCQLLGEQIYSNTVNFSTTVMCDVYCGSLAGASR